MGEIQDFDAVLDAAQRGDGEALATLYRVMHPKVLRYLRSTLRDEAEDVAHEVWIQVSEGIGRFSGDEADLKKWMFTIAIRRRIDAQRRRARHAIPASESLPDQAVRDRDVAASLYATELLQRLPVEMAEILLLRVVVGLDAASVGELVGKNPGAVRVCAHRAIQRLRAIVADEETDRAVEQVVAQPASAPAVEPQPVTAP